MVFAMVVLVETANKKKMGEDMKRYKPRMFTENPVTKEIRMFEDYRAKIPYLLGEDHIRIRMKEDPEGDWVKWEDVGGIEKAGFQCRDGYIRTKDLAIDMAVSLHQVFDRDAATLRFKIKDCQPIIIDVDLCIFEEFMRTHSVKKEEPESLKCNCVEMAREKMERYVQMSIEKCWICPAHGYKRR